MSHSVEQLSALAVTLKSRPDWYNDPEFLALYREYFVQGDGSETTDNRTEKWELVTWFAGLLAQGLIYLNNAVKNGYNDDDRKGKYEGPEKAALVDTIVVHHTTTDETLTLWQLDAISLLRLYVPLFMTEKPSSFVKFLVQVHPELQNQPLAPASGHFMQREGRKVQTFVGYHYLIWVL